MMIVAGAEYSSEIIEEAKRLYRSGWRVKHISMKLRIPRTNIYTWLDLTGKTLPEPDDNARTVDEYHDELRVYAEHYRTLDVQLLGDPPLHRSALWRRHEEG